MTLERELGISLPAGFNDQFQWTLKSGEPTTAVQWANSTDTVYGELEGILGDIELALDAQYDKDYADELHLHTAHGAWRT